MPLLQMTPRLRPITSTTAVAAPQIEAESELDADRAEEARLIAEVRRRNVCEGPAWDVLHDRLWIYAWKTLQRKIASGEISALVSKHDPFGDLHLSPEDAVVLRRSPDDRAELAIDVIRTALEDFKRNAVLKGKWSPTAGASLTTYFLGTCALHFRRTYWTWSEERFGRLERTAARFGIDTTYVERHFRAIDSDASVDPWRLELAQFLLSKADPLTKTIFLLKVRGLTHAEIAAEIGMSTAAVSSRVRRFSNSAKATLAIQETHYAKASAA
ncbi:sigma factor-like helix-turn-helix DNA-binding protein [Dactylosporangium cerinum]|uniref:Sigma factor-like helix-turn-helix DNA-binding protein n=1 Tax=Dactylosporangium cerinum TaxID=1434730 RepID=A0ABV9WKU9_9ACTN